MRIPTLCWLARKLAGSAARVLFGPEDKTHYVSRTTTKE